MKISAMAKIYKKRIEAGIMALDEVPERWRKEVEELLKKDETIEQYDNI